MPSAFISYRRIPSAMLAQLIVDRLDERGIKTFIDVRQVDGGGPFPDRLRRAIEDHDIFVCLVADTTFESEWVREEIAHAHRLGKVLIPVFQESWENLRRKPTPPNEHVAALLQCDGVHVLDRRNIYIDDALNQLAHMIRQSGPRRDLRSWSVGMGILAMLVIAAFIVGVLLLGNRDDGNDETDTPVTTHAAVLPTDPPDPTRTQPPSNTPPSTLEMAYIVQTADAKDTAVALTQQTSMASHWTQTPTPNMTVSVIAFRTQNSANQTATATLWTVTSTPTPTFTPSPIPAGSNNTAWTPMVEGFDGIPMVYVPSGCFMMGSTDREIEAAFQICEEERMQNCPKNWFEDETPAHEVCLNAYWIGQTEVTNAQYRRCVEAGVCELPEDKRYYDDDAYANHPVVDVSWDNASQYVTWLSNVSEHEYALPTEAQWEYAARGPGGWVYPWGNAFDETKLNYCDTSCEYGWHKSGYDDGYSHTAPVGSFLNGASWVGALDMAGNAWEWGADRYSENYYTEQTISGIMWNPSGPGEGTGRVARGGSWRLSYQDELRAAARSSNVPFWVRDLSWSFRVAMTIPDS